MTRPKGMRPLTDLRKHSEVTGFHKWAGSKDRTYHLAKQPFDLWLHFPTGVVKTYGRHQTI